MALTKRYVSATGVAIYALSISNATPMSIATAMANAVAGDWIQIQNGAYTLTTLVPTNAGTSTDPIIWEGVNANWSSISPSRTNGGGPLVTTSLPAWAFTSTNTLTSSAQNIWRNLNITGSVSGPLFTVVSSTVIESCVVNNSSTNAAATAISVSGTNTQIIDSDESLSGGSGGAAALAAAGNALRLVGGRITGGAGAPGITGTAGMTLSKTTIFASTIGLSFTGTAGILAFDGLTVVGNSSDGIKLASGVTSTVQITNSAITDNGGIGINSASSACSLFLRNNRYRNNTGGDVSSIDWVAGSNLGTQSGGGTSDYVDAAGNDYRLVSTSLAVASGFPAFADIGSLNGSDVSTDPGVANVVSTATYTFQGAAKTGTYVVVATTNVKLGITFGAGSAQTGTYDPITGQYTDPGIGQVVSGTAYIFGGVSLIGTYNGVTPGQAAEFVRLNDQGVIQTSSESHGPTLNAYKAGSVN